MPTWNTLYVLRIKLDLKQLNSTLNANGNLLVLIFTDLVCIIDMDNASCRIDPPPIGISCQQAKFQG